MTISDHFEILVINHFTFEGMNTYCLRILISAFVLGLLVSCNQSPNSNSSEYVNENGLFQYFDSTLSGIDFINEVVDGEDFNVLSYRNFYNGGGVGIGDINNDGLSDVFFTANMGPNHLYVNKGGLKFEDISISAGITGDKGWSTGVSMVDINGDGFLDIYVSNSGDVQGDNRENELFINNRDLTFTERAKEYNLNNSGFTTHASFFDYDRDGDLDCYILNNSFKDPSRIDIFSRTRYEQDTLGGDRLMRNDGGSFVDVTKDAGIFSSAIGFGLGVSIGDIDNDGWPDIYISNDFWERDYLYINQQDGTFKEELTDRLSICSVSSMGADIGDINNDGNQDIFSTDMLAADNYRLKAMTLFDPYHLEDLKFRSSYHYQILQNCLQINNGAGNFQEVGALSGVSATDWSWGALLFDFDNDGWKDIYVCNGIYHDIMYLDFANFIEDKEQVKKVVTEKGRYDFRDFVEFLPTNPIDNYAFVNQKNLQFKNKAAELGFRKGEFSNGAAYGDLDNDGDYDLVINNVNMPASVYINQSDKAENNYLSVKLMDESSSNKLAIGAKLIAYLGGEKLSQEHYINRGFQSSVGSEVIFGLSDRIKVDSLDIFWPDGTLQRSRDIAGNQILTILKSADVKTVVNNEMNLPELFTDRSSIINNNKPHKENTFNDFDIERLLPRMQSTEGPKLALGDVNGDGLSDFVALGASGDPDKLFIQSSNGSFTLQNIPSFVLDQSYESTCAALYDADGDKDLDLLIGSGGNKLTTGMQGFEFRFYENPGDGKFIKVPFKAPPGGGQVSVIAPADFDNDGDLDLFIGGRSVPGNYGLTPRSFLFKNDGGQYVDVTEKEIGTLGMVTDALWSDVDTDGDLDLITVGEWMPVTMLINTEGKLSNMVTVPNSKGWWLDITQSDLNNDGKPEFIVGNWGYNTKFKASPDRPLKMFVKDFDQNGKTEFVLNWYPPLDDKLYPFATKMDISEQLPSLKKKFLKYDEYARQDYLSMFSEQERGNAKELTCETLASSKVSFDGANWILTPLPLAAQVSPAFAIAPIDYNQDGFMDLWIGGNFYGLKPEMGRHDSSRGVLLKNIGNGVLEEVKSRIPMALGEVRDAAVINAKNSEAILLIARNNQSIKAISFN